MNHQWIEYRGARIIIRMVRLPCLSTSWRVMIGYKQCMYNSDHNRYMLVFTILGSCAGQNGRNLLADITIKCDHFVILNVWLIFIVNQSTGHSCFRFKLYCSKTVPLSWKSLQFSHCLHFNKHQTLTNEGKFSLCGINLARKFAETWEGYAWTLNFFSFFHSLKAIQTFYVYSLIHGFRAPLLDQIF